MVRRVLPLCKLALAAWLALPGGAAAQPARTTQSVTVGVITRAIVPLASYDAEAVPADDGTR
jgi:hypothetical protein